MPKAARASDSRRATHAGWQPGVKLGAVGSAEDGNE